MKAYSPRFWASKIASAAYLATTQRQPSTSIASNTRVTATGEWKATRHRWLRPALQRRTYSSGTICPMPDSCGVVLCLAPSTAPRHCRATSTAASWTSRRTRHVQRRRPCPRGGIHQETGNQVPVVLLSQVDQKIDDGGALTGRFRFSEYARSGGAPAAAGTVGACVNASGKWDTSSPVAAANCGAAGLM